MSATLENDHLRINVSEKGAELRSVQNKQTKLEYMWNADPAFWSKSSPILFPIVGTLRNNSFLYQGKFYTLTRHGFARDMVFNITEQRNDCVTFQLLSNDKTLEVYPFDFNFEIRYQIDRDLLSVTYYVNNTGSDTMYFSIGAHPAFKVPLTPGTKFEDYFLKFSESETAPRWPIDSNGLIMDNPTPLLENTTKMILNHDLFNQDALVFKNLRSDKISINSDKHENGIDFHFKGFPFLGIWSAKNADFVCIEPWCGIADSVLHNQKLVEKEGIIELSPAGSWTRSWTVRFY